LDLFNRDYELTKAQNSKIDSEINSYSSKDLDVLLSKEINRVDLLSKIF
jgi:hypothetical protein